MEITQTKITLSDGKPAIQLDGLDLTPVYIRVSCTASSPDNGQLLDHAFQIQAYQVSEDGTTQGLKSGVCTAVMHNGNGNFQVALEQARASSIEDFSNRYESVIATQLVPIDLT